VSIRPAMRRERRNELTPVRRYHCTDPTTSAVPDRAEMGEQTLSSAPDYTHNVVSVDHRRRLTDIQDLSQPVETE
jgi:hypothetical protein